MVHLQLGADFVLERHLRRSEPPFLNQKNHNKRLTSQKICTLHQQLTWHRPEWKPFLQADSEQLFSLSDQHKGSKNNNKSEHAERPTCFLCACQKYFQSWDAEDLRVEPNQANFNILERRGDGLREFDMVSLKHVYP